MLRIRNHAAVLDHGRRDWETARDDAAEPGTGAPRSVLFLSAASADLAADAVRDAALDLAGRSALPGLLLDLAIPGNRQYQAFAAAGLLEPRTTPGTTRAAAPPSGFAVLHFERLRGSRLFISRVTPDPTRFADITWNLAGASALARLRRLFGIIVIAGPELERSPGGLRLAPCVDGVVLVLRSGETTMADATRLRDRVRRVGGRLVGAVMTGCRPDDARPPYPFAEPWWADLPC